MYATDYLQDMVVESKEKRYYVSDDGIVLLRSVLCRRHRDFVPLGHFQTRRYNRSVAVIT
jgi:hypothetical protein